MDSALATMHPFGPFSKRFEKVETLHLDPGFSQLLARDQQTQNQVRLQLIQEPSVGKDPSLQSQWEAIKACQDSLWFRPQEWLVKDHCGILISWVPPGRYFNEIEGTLPDKIYLKWMGEALRDLAHLHQQGLLHLAQTAQTWILFKADEEEGEECMGLSDLGLLAEVLLGRRVSGEAVAAIAPELLRGQAVDERADLYSLACLILRQRSGHQFQRFNSLKKNLELHWEGRMVEQVPDSSTTLNEILRAMLQPNPADRPADVAEVLKMIDSQADEIEGHPASFPDWSQGRVRARQNTMILNCLHSLVATGEKELSAVMMEELSDYLQKDHEVYLRYLQARLSQLQGDSEAAQEWRRQASVKSYSQPDPKLKALLCLEESRVHQDNLKVKEALASLNQAWDTVCHFPDPNLQAEVLYERGRMLRKMGEDAKALEVFQEAYLRIPEQGPHALKGAVYGELAELLSAYGMPRQAVPLVEESMAQVEENPRDHARRYLQYALSYNALLDWDKAEENFSKARFLYSSLKNLEDLTWANAHQVRLHLAKRDFPQARRELKALRSRTRGKKFHGELLDLLELNYWLEVGSTLTSSPDALLDRIQGMARESLENGFYRDLGWPPKETCQLFERFFQKKKKYREAANFAKVATEMNQGVLQKFKSYQYEEESPPIPVVREVPSAPVGEEPPSVFSTVRPVKVKSLLSGGELRDSETDTPKPPPADQKNLAERIVHLEQRLREAEDLKYRLLQKTERQAREIESLKQLQTETPGMESPVSSPDLPLPEKAMDALSNPEGSDDSEKAKIEAALQKHQGNKSHAAKELKIHRRTLFEKIKKYGLDQLSFLPSREEMVRALEACEGKKSKAAKSLGMSRSSFYRRMKELDIS